MELAQSIFQLKIVGYKRTDGTIIGAWCWNDGYNINNDLKEILNHYLVQNLFLKSEDTHRSQNKTLIKDNLKNVARMGFQLANER